LAKLDAVEAYQGDNILDPKADARNRPKSADCGEIVGCGELQR